MKCFKRIILCSVILLMVCACSSSRGTYTVSLNGSSNSDYTWTYEIADTTILSMNSEDYYGDENSDEIIGLGGTYEFELKALKEGSTEVVFNYKKSWEEDEILYTYTANFEVDSDLNIEEVSEEGNYLGLVKIMNVDKENLDLDSDINEYKILFEEDLVTVNNEECYYLSVYNYDDEYINNYAVSVGSDNIYKNVDGELVLID